MCRLSDSGKMVVNAHGMFHLRADAYVRDGRIDPLESVGLDEAATAGKLDAVCEFIRRVFDKEPQGFVAPSWGYEPGVAKRVAARTLTISPILTIAGVRGQRRHLVLWIRFTALCTFPRLGVMGRTAWTGRSSGAVTRPLALAGMAALLSI